MTTISNGESGLSVRNKINEAINKVDGVTPFGNNIDVTGTVTASTSLNVTSGIPYIDLKDTSTTDYDGRILNYAGGFSVRTLNDASSAATLRLNIDHATGDISFYEDTGTTPKFFWDASTERLGIGNAAPATALDVTGTITATRLQTVNAAIGTDADVQFFADANNTAVRTKTSGGGVYIQSNDGAKTHARFDTPTGDISFYEDTGTTPKFFWDASAEALGIGTSSLDSTLTVEAAQGLISVKSTTGSKRLVFGSDAFTDAFFGTTTAHNLSIISGGIIGATLNTSGNLGIGTNSPSEKLSVTGNVTISGSLSKGSGSFKIDHPIKPDTHHLVHSFIEGPQADNIYRGKVALAGGKATVNLDEAGRMSEGTFVALNSNVQCFTTNEDGWTPVRGKVEGNILTIEAQDATCTDTVSWLVIGERHDQHMIGANWTDEQGRVITEPEKGTAS